jgi:hypothetical protein
MVEIDAAGAEPQVERIRAAATRRLTVDLELVDDVPVERGC